MPKKLPIVKSVGLPVVMVKLTLRVWTVRVDHKESRMLKNWCFWTVVLEKTLESPLDCKEIKAVHHKGNQPWIFIGRIDAQAKAPILWLPDAKNWLIGKDPDDGKDWRQEEKGKTENKMVEWHYWLNGHEFEQARGDSWGFPGGSDGKESACNAGDPCSIPRWGRSSGEGMATHSSILA